MIGAVTPQKAYGAGFGGVVVAWGGPTGKAVVINDDKFPDMKVQAMDYGRSRETYKRFSVASAV